VIDEGLDADLVLERGTWSLSGSFSVASGEVVGLLGANGAGKSSVLEALAGLIPLAGGQVVLDGETLESVPEGGRRTGTYIPPRLRRVGWLPQDAGLLPDRDVLGNVTYGLCRAGGLPRSEARRRARSLLASAGLDHLADRRPHELSGGEARRVALVRTLAIDPALVLLDEPLTGIDDESRTSLREQLRTWATQAGRVTLLATHEPADIAELADRSIRIEEGQIVGA
jgi:molybdate transport system ATP-binding protein